MSWSTSELRVRLAPFNWFKPSSKIFYWPFQGGTSFVDLLCFCSVLCLLCLCARLFICALWSPAGKGLTSWLSFVVSTVSLSLSHWYPRSGVVLDCIDSWSLHPYLLSCFQQEGLINQLHHKNTFRPCLWCSNLAKIEGTLDVDKLSLIGFGFHFGISLRQMTCNG